MGESTRESIEIWETSRTSIVAGIEQLPRIQWPRSKEFGRVESMNISNKRLNLSKHTSFHIGEQAA